MFGSKIPLTDKIKEALAEFVDEKFEEYRGQISNELSKGIAGLAGLVVIWSMAIMGCLFMAFSVALLIGWVLSFYWPVFGYVVSFLCISCCLIILAYCLFKKKQTLIEQPVYKIISILLENPNFTEHETIKSDYKARKSSQLKQVFEEEEDINRLGNKDNAK